MQSVNNDMDDLFRRAAEDYPLHTEGADWNEVMQRLESSRRGAMPQNTKKQKSFLWIAAIFLIVICTTYIQKTERIAQPGVNTSLIKTGDHSKGEKMRPDEVLAPDQKTNVGGVVHHSENSMVHKEGPRSPFLILPNEKAPDQITENPNKRTETIVHGLAERNGATEIAQYGFVEVERITKAYGQPSALDSLRLREPGRIDNATKEIEETPESKKVFGQRLYAGFAAGPDISTIRSQKVNDAGYTLGLLVGYKFNKRLSLESGVLWDRKDYYTTGEYFNKGSLGLPQYAKIIDVDGYCNMFEIPVNLKFNWAQKNHYNLFATTGISSYLMKKEAYDYTVDYYGVQHKYNKQYNNASRNWVSILNLSIGYEKKIGKAGSLRLEPYLKLPLKGVGIGDMPIGSKGVLIGFTRPIL
jgi:hypothetical protein